MMVSAFLPVKVAGVHIQGFSWHAPLSPPALHTLTKFTPLLFLPNIDDTVCVWECVSVSEREREVSSGVCVFVAQLPIPQVLGLSYRSYAILYHYKRFPLY